MMARSWSQVLGKTQGSNPPLGVFLGPDGRLPGFAQRRLDDLIARKKISVLSVDEERELAEALDYIDEKSSQMLDWAAANQVRSKNIPLKRPRKK